MEWFKEIYNIIMKKSKNMTNLAVILIIGIIILIAGNSLFGSSNKQANTSSPAQTTHTVNTKNKEKDYGEQLEKKMEIILSEIEGVGKVSVMITFYSGTEIVPAMDTKTDETTTQENDNQGGSRKITQSQQDHQILVMNQQGGDQQPLILKEKQPIVKGVIVAAEGASDIRVKRDIHDAVKIVLGVPAHKVQVFKKR